MHRKHVVPAFLASFAKSLAVLSLRAGASKLTRVDSQHRGEQHVTRQQDTLAAQQRAGDGTQRQPKEQSVLAHAKAFIEKFGKDWTMNLCSLLAYNFLGAIFPLLLGILALSAIFLPASMVQQIGASLNGAIPSAANGQNGLNLDFNTILASFHGSNASKITLIVSFAALLWTGSSLFGVMENCFSIIFRTKDRDFIWQKLMSVAMIVIFAILTPLSFVASSVSGSYDRLSSGLASGVPFIGAAFAIGGYVIGLVFAFALFFLIYLIVPNVKMAWEHTWRGALVAAILFEAASLVFPIYTAHGGKSQFGAIAGLLAILTMWFWVISLILLLGAEVNSYFGLGQRATAGRFARRAARHESPP